jgi:putative FmdB family regulatory protein
MPIYEYRCSACGHQQEFLQKVSDPPQTICTACGKPTFSKMLTAAGFQLKGSGWYATDFRNQGSAPKAAEVKGEAKAEAKGETKTEAKSEAKAETKSESKPDAPSSPAKAP